MDALLAEQPPRLPLGRARAAALVDRVFPRSNQPTHDVPDVHAIVAALQPAIDAEVERRVTEVLDAYDLRRAAATEIRTAASAVRSE